MLNHTKLRCYQRTLEVIKMLHKDMPTWPGSVRGLKDQITRASTSAVLNLVEGCGKLTSKDKRRFYAIARGSLLEVGAGLDVACAMNIVSANKNTIYQQKLLSITKMISMLIKKT